MDPCEELDLRWVEFVVVIRFILVDMTRFLPGLHSGVVRNHYNLAKWVCFA